MNYTTKKSIFLILFSILSLNFLVAQTAYTNSNLNLRDTPSANGNILTIIPKISIIHIENCSGGWCNIMYSGIQGYVRESYLEKNYSNSEYNNNSVKFYINSFGKRVQSPTNYDSAPSSATAQCYDGTYSFSQSRRGTCSHHGGVRRWIQ